MHLFYCTILSLIFGAFLALNLFIWNNFYLAIFLGLAYFFSLSFILGKTFFYAKSLPFQFIYGLLFILLGISFSGAVIYYFYEINNWVVVAFLILFPLILLPITIFRKRELQAGELTPLKITSGLLLNSFLAALFLLLEILNFNLLIRFSTEEAIRTPWAILPFRFFVLFFLSSLVLIIFIIKNKNGLLGLLLVGLHTFFIVGVALIIYKIGYGFDPFIHQATEKIIFNEGFVLPKPLYYLGQYSLVVFLAKILFLPIEIVDKFLLPIFIAIFLPTTIYFSFRQIFFGGNYQTEKNLNPILLCLAVFILPFPSFINTTPQGLANFLLLLLILLSVLSLKKEFPLSLLWFLAFTIFLIHPLAGLPAFIFIILFTIFSLSFNKTIKNALLSLIFLAASFAIPAFFALASFILGKNGSVFSVKSPENIFLFFKDLNWHLPVIINHFNPFLDLVYAYGKNISFIIALAALVGLFLIGKKMPTVFIYPLIFLSIIINYILLKSFISFPALIQYEQNIYPSRILEISFYFLIPPFLFAIYKFYEKVLKSAPAIKIFFVLLLSIFMTFSLYYSYPKDDGEDYHIDRGYSVSRADISAVNKIEEDAAGEDYIALANQSVSAAAIREFGFAEYYGPYFYYPIPTGDPLYQYYLKMVYESPKRETIKEAAELTGVNLVYFVLNKYWTDADKISPEAQKNADETIFVDNKITIFKYQF
jgi:hypothetical protein